MNFLSLFHILALLTAPVLGLLVYLTNRARTANFFFFLFSAVMTLWLAFLGGAFTSRDPVATAWFIRESNMVSVFAVFTFNGLRMALLHPAYRARDIVRNTWPLLLASVAVAGMCASQFFLREVTFAPGAQIAEPHYGPGILLYGAFHSCALLYLTWRFVQDTRKSTGIVRTELQFLMLGSGVGISVAILTAVVIPLLTQNSNSVVYAPLAAVALEGITAYGIATRRIMDVAGLVRRATAYMLLTCYLLAIYFLVWWLGQALLHPFTRQPEFLAHLLAALATTFSLAPANGLLQQFANRLFLNLRSVDATDVMQRANLILTSVADRDDMLNQFATLLSSTFGTDRTLIVLNEAGKWRVRYPKGKHPAPVLPADHPVIAALADGEAPLVADVLARFRSGPAERALTAGLKELQAAIAIGIHAQDGLRGIILLGSRLSGRIYSWDEQRALQVLSNQLSVGLENTDLYTRVQDSAIYNNILLDNLVSGVIAVGADRRITVFNREAQRIVRRSSGDVLHQPMEALPQPLAAALRATFEQEHGMRDREILLRLGDHEERPIRLGTTLFHSHTGKTLGALMVFDDLTAIKKLEGQVRRTDRLASLGTLSAGMAHEIKNPLVTLKTFTQLLPERYEDPDFRETFSSLVGHEVKRIDSIVNQLLRFARPAKPSLSPTNLHEVVDNTLRLVHQQLRQKNIALHRNMEVEMDRIQGDSDLLVQAFLNLFLNAIDAMEEGGSLHVSTEQLASDSKQGFPDEAPAGERLRLSIRDTGKGIRSEDLPHVFDPFFTTKSTGTGLGLSVSHGIIHEHHAVIDVESEEGRGTSFHITFPMLGEEVTP